ncbi:unnamed protein product [Protopolystoma xenopodis]|uniref:Reverse transcriptase domain-containing protein n=1 Tax=Protopolystoma xenopodis TaxID=117903 RepID=A0A448XCX5_9PLAT|nr:unnamed protein product [Protopolystoma xenopodis]
MVLRQMVCSDFQCLHELAFLQAYKFGDWSLLRVGRESLILFHDTAAVLIDVSQPKASLSRTSSNHNSVKATEVTSSAMHLDQAGRADLRDSRAAEDGLTIYLLTRPRARLVDSADSVQAARDRRRRPPLSERHVTTGPMDAWRDDKKGRQHKLKVASSESTGLLYRCDLNRSALRNQYTNLKESTFDRGVNPCWVASALEGKDECHNLAHGIQVHQLGFDGPPVDRTAGDKAISALMEILEREEDILEAERIRKKSLTRLINLTVRTKYFTFNGSIYEQIFGLPMGSPLSPLLVNVYMDKLEKEFEKSPLQLRVLMRYWDDFFAL